ncbi:MAG: S-layer homology domain-containing protein, partial [Oscillospiraceae bacterium]|nr:S-layer homology domain-containing protein [Oscillospiraceae bacterium]
VTLPDNTVSLKPTSSDNYANTAVTLAEINGDMHAMLAWSYNGGAAQTTLRVMLDGTAGNRWGSSVNQLDSDVALAATAVTIKSADGLFADVPLTLAQLKAHSATKTGYTMNSTIYTTVTGIMLSDLLRYYVPDYALADSVYFCETDSSKSNEFTPLESAHDSAMLLWSGVRAGATVNYFGAKLYSALDGGSGKYWWSGITSVTVGYPTSAVTFAATPAGASVKVTDASGGVIAAQSDGTYKLAVGKTYTWLVSAPGYTSADGTVTPASAAAETVTVTLQQNSGGGTATTYRITAYSGAHGTVTPNVTTAASGTAVTLTVAPAADYGLSALTAGGAPLNRAVSANVYTYTFTMPPNNVAIGAAFDAIVFTVYSQNGAAGTKVKAAVFTHAGLVADSDKNDAGYAYLYAQSDVWKAIVATQVITLDTLFDAGGISGYWKSGSYLSFIVTDQNPGGAEYPKAYMSYDDVRLHDLYISGQDQTVVPAGIAVKWESGELGAGGVAALAAAARDSGNIRFVYGISADQYLAMNAAGARSPSQIMSMTVVYDAADIPGGSVGTEHGTDVDLGDDGDTPLSGLPSAITKNPATDIGFAATVSRLLSYTVSTFTDVKATAWYAEYVGFAYEYGLMEGVGGRLFAPNGKTTRAQVLTVLARMAGVDTSTGVWYEAAVEWAVANDVSDGSNLGGNITREQLVTLLWRFAGKPEATSRPAFSDLGSLSDYAEEALAWAVEAGIIEGKPGNIFDPKGSATRAEVAKVFERYLNG